MRVVYGMNPVRELLRSGAEGVTELWLAEGGERPRAFAELEKGARERGAKVRAAPRSKLDRLAGVTQHQGIVAVVADYRYRELDEILAAAGGVRAARRCSSCSTAWRTRTTSAPSSGRPTRWGPTAW